MSVDGASVHDFLNIGLGANAPKEESAEDECEGLLLPKEASTSGDFHGTEVRADSMVATTKITIMVPNEGPAQREAVPGARGSEKWMEARSVYLAKSEVKLRELHESTVSQLLILLNEVRKLDISLATLQSHGMEEFFRLACVLQRMYNDVDSVLSPLSTAAVPPRKQLPSIASPPEMMLMGSGDAELVRWHQHITLVIAETVAETKARLSLLEQIINDVNDRTQEALAPSSSGGARKDDDKEWGTFFVRRTDESRCHRIMKTSDPVTDILRTLLLPPRRLAIADGSADPDADADDTARSLNLMRMLILPDAWNLVSSTPLFQRNVDSMDVLNAICSSLQPMLFTPQSTIIRSGTVGTKMFFINSGCAQVVINGKPGHQRHKGDFIGEIALLYATERTADIVAAESTEAFMLSRKQFSRIAQQYPHVLERIAAVGVDRVKRNNWGSKVKSKKRFRVLPDDEDTEAGPAAGAEDRTASAGSTGSGPERLASTRTQGSWRNLEGALGRSESVASSVSEDGIPECLLRLKRVFPEIARPRNAPADVPAQAPRFTAAAYGDNNFQMLVTDTAAGPSASLRTPSDASAPPQAQQTAQGEGSVDAFTSFAMRMRRVELPAGEMLLRKGEAGVGLWLLETGTCLIDTKPKPLTVGPGAMFGLGPLMFTGTPGFDVTVGEGGAGLWGMEREELMELMGASDDCLVALSEMASLQCQGKSVFSSADWRDGQGLGGRNCGEPTGGAVGAGVSFPSDDLTFPGAADLSAGMDFGMGGSSVGAMDFALCGGSDSAAGGGRNSALGGMDFAEAGSSMRGAGAGGRSSGSLASEFGLGGGGRKSGAAGPGNDFGIGGPNGAASSARGGGGNAAGKAPRRMASFGSDLPEDLDSGLGKALWEYV